MTIYRSFLDGYDKGSQQLNMAWTTSSFEARAYVKGCLKQFGLDHQAASARHHFAPDSFAAHKVQFVDPARHKLQDPDDALLRGATVDQARADGFAAGIFTFSEIVFSPSHRKAAFTYSFVCGRLCGNGATIVYQLQGGKWNALKTDCGSWAN